MIEKDKIEQSSVKDRLLQFIAFKKISQRKFEELSNLSNGYVNNMRESIKPSTFDSKIKPVFPELNKMWLLFNEGEMLIKSKIENNENSVFQDLSIEEKLNLIYNQNIEIKNQNIEIKEALVANREILEMNKERIEDTIYVMNEHMKTITNFLEIKVAKTKKDKLDKILQKN